MDRWTTALYSGLIIALALSLPVIVIIVITKIIVDQKKQNSISPLSDGFLRGPGHSLRLKYDKAWSDMAVHFMLLPIFSLMPLAIIGSNSIFKKTTNFWFMVIFFITTIIIILKNIIPTTHKILQTKLGLEAEIACGQLLSQLMRNGWYVFHDIPSQKINGKFNIDHILIGPPGVYVVETKGRSKSLTKTGGKQSKILFKNNRLEFPNNKFETKPLEQALANTRHIAEWLPRASGVKFAPEPALLFPGWYFEAKEKPPFPLIGNPKLIVDTLKSKSQAVLTPEQCEQIAYQVEQAVRLSDYLDGADVKR